MAYCSSSGNCRSLNFGLSTTIGGRTQLRRAGVARSLGSGKWRCSAGRGDEDPEESREIPATTDELLRKLSSEAYTVRRSLEQNIESSSYDVLDSNPWRDDSKPVYVLAREGDRLLTMRTRRERSEVEKELNMLFSKNRRVPALGSRFRMQVEDIREGVLVFEDEHDAAQYCDLLEGNCRGIAEIEASAVFALCQRNKALAVLFRKGTQPPLPDRLEQNLKARKHSLEDS